MRAPTCLRWELFFTSCWWARCRTRRTPRRPRCSSVRASQSKRPVDVDPDVPVVLSDITTKCLQMDPALRYQSALEIQRDIDAWRGGSTKRIDIPVTTEPEKIAPPKSRTPLMLWAAAALLLAVGGAFVGKKYFFPSGAAATPAAALNSLAILPFHNASSDAKLDWLGSSMAEMLSTDVGQSASVRMVSTDRVGQVLKDLHITPQSGLDAPTVGRVANLSNVDTVVWGQYAQFGDHIRIDATIQDFKRGRTATVKEDAASEKEILAAVDRLAAQIRSESFRFEEPAERAAGARVQAFHVFHLRAARI